jgi:hypothetical protein
MKKIVTLATAALAMSGLGTTALLTSGAGASSPTYVTASPASSGASTNALTGVGWQSDFSYAVPTGVGGVFFHYPCPGALVADSGKYDVDFGDPAANSFHVIATGVRTDVAGKHEMMWKINYFGAGAPAGSHIVFNVHCVKK